MLLPPGSVESSSKDPFSSPVWKILRTGGHVPMMMARQLTAMRVSASAPALVVVVQRTMAAKSSSGSTNQVTDTPCSTSYSAEG